MNKHKIHLGPVPLWLSNLTFFFCVVTASLSLLYFHAQRIVQEREVSARAQGMLMVQPGALNDPFTALDLKAKAVAVYDISTKRLIYGRNETQQLPLASLTKIMTTIVAAGILPSYTSISIVPSETEADVRLRSGEIWPLSDLVNYTLLTSSNTGANSIAAAAASVLSGHGSREGESVSPAFIAAMNRKAVELNLNQTYFLNSTGLDTTVKVGGAYGSASDIARLFSYALKQYPDVMTSTSLPQVNFTAPDGHTITAKNTNRIVSELPGIIGSKTGFTDLAGGNLVIAFDISFGEPIVIAVLGSTEDDRFTDVSKLVQATIAYFGAPLSSYNRTIE